MLGVTTPFPMASMTRSANSSVMSPRRGCPPSLWKWQFQNPHLPRMLAQHRKGRPVGCTYLGSVVRYACLSSCFELLGLVDSPMSVFKVFLHHGLYLWVSFVFPTCLPVSGHVPPWRELSTKCWAPPVIRISPLVLSSWRGVPPPFPWMWALSLLTLVTPTPIPMCMSIVPVWCCCPLSHAL
jgi:hypothetical protein